LFRGREFIDNKSNLLLFLNTTLLLSCLVTIHRTCEIVVEDWTCEIVVEDWTCEIVVEDWTCEIVVGVEHVIL